MDTVLKPSAEEKMLKYRSSTQLKEIHVYFTCI